MRRFRRSIVSGRSLVSIDVVARARAVVRVTLVLCLAGLVGGLGVAGAAGAPKVTATVKPLSQTSYLVRIVNRDQAPYRQFVIQSVRTPKIVGATKPCAVQRDGVANGTEFIWRYTAKCNKTLAPGRTLNIVLTTQGKGRLSAYVVVKSTLVPITP